MSVRVLYGGSFISPGGGARVTREIARALDAPITMTHMLEPSFWDDVETEVMFQDHFAGGVTGAVYRRLPAGIPAKMVSQKLKSLNFEEDVIVSTSNASMWTVPKYDQRHVHYCNTPPRYYYAEPTSGIISWLKQTGQAMLDQHFLTFVDEVVANSEYTRQRIRRHYRHDATVLTPPVETDRFYDAESEGYFILVGRLVPKKRVRTVAEAVDNLVIVGDGPLEDKCRNLGADVQTDVSDEELADIVAKAAGGIALARDEHYGITPKEFQAAGKPVIVPNEPNLCNHVTDGLDGVVVEPTVAGVWDGVERIRQTEWDPARIQETAATASPERFQAEIREVVNDV